MRRRWGIQSKILAALVMVTGLASAAYSVALVNARRTALIGNADARLATAAESLHDLLGPGYHDRIVEASSVPPEEWERIVARNDDLCRRLGLQYLWSVMVLGDDIVFTSATHSNIRDPSSPCARFFEVHRDPHAFDPVLAAGRTTFSTFRNEWGKGRMVLIPKRDSRGRLYLLGASVQLEGLGAAVRRTVMKALGMSAGFAVAALLLSVLLARTLSAPIIRLTRAAGQMAGGDLDTEFEPATTAEVDVLRGALDSMRRSIRAQMETIRVEEERFRTSVESMLDGFAILSGVRDGGGRIVDLRFDYINDAGCAMNEIGREEHIGRTLLDVYPMAGPTGLLREYIRVAETGNPFTVESRPYKGLLGRPEVSRRFDIRSFKVGDNVAVIWRDVTERVRMEEALRESHEELEDKVREKTAALKETTRTLEELVAASPMGIFVLDPEGKVLLWNPAMEKILGWTEEEVRGKLPPTVAGGREESRETLERLLAGENLSGVELRRVRKDGQPVDLRLWNAPIRGEGGRLRSAVNVLQDITRLKEMERVALVQEKLASLGHLAAGIAHEIRNPLSGLNLSLSAMERLLSEKEALDSETRESAEAIVAMMKGASTKMEATIQRVLAFSRPGSIRRELFDVNACIREAVDMAQASLRKAGTAASVALREDLPACRGDAFLLAQVLVNLLTNAAQAMKGQEKEKRIEISSDVRNGHVTVSVADSGPGVPEELQEKIFDPFFTTKKEGTGIGLSITHKIVTDHGGFIKAGTSRFGGALFTVGLPTGDRGNI